MNKNTLIQTAVISVIFFAMLFLISFIGSMSPTGGGLKIEPIHVFIALMPFIILLIASGKLKEIKGPGGIALLMRDEAERGISLEVENNALEIDPQITHEKGGLESLLHMISERPPTALSFVLEKRGYYGNYAIETYIRELRALSEFRYIIFVSISGKFSGYMKVDDFAILLEKGNIIEGIESASILQNKNMYRDKIKANSSNREALSAMEKANVNELAVVDSSDKFVGIINQEQIVRKVLSKIVREA